MSHQIIQDRREFLKASIMAFGGAIMLPSCLRNYTPFLFFTADEALLLTAICEQIIPADENGPGATQAGVIYYIDKQLYEVFTWEQDKYRLGLTAINESSLELFSANFDMLPTDKQLLFLKKMEGNELPDSYWKDNSASGFFRTIIQHTMQGFYGPPRHGGNKNYISYKMINLDYPYVVGRNLYE